MRKRSRRRRSGFSRLRWVAVAGLALIAFLYYRPVHSYFQTRSALAARRAEIAQLRAQHLALARRLAASTSTTALEREARRLGLVRPDERLFIVKGIRSWLRRHRPQPTIAGNG